MSANKIIVQKQALKDPEIQEYFKHLEKLNFKFLKKNISPSSKLLISELWEIIRGIRSGQDATLHDSGETVTIKEASEMLGFSRPTVYKLVADKELVNLGKKGSPKITLASIEAYLENRDQKKLVASNIYGQLMNEMDSKDEFEFITDDDDFEDIDLD